MSDTTTQGIRVQVETAYDAERSIPMRGQYLFAYTIRISNVGDEVVQLLSRSWIITDAEGGVEKVEGPGVIGEQPTLAPGGSFGYTSFCPLPTPFGTMQGTYTMQTAAGRTFLAEIAPFSLTLPHAVN